MFTYVAFKMLEQAGYRVTSAGDIPGLWNVEGLASDVTTNQLHELAKKHGDPWVVEYRLPYRFQQTI